jgi:hypothetical protein
VIFNLILFPVFHQHIRIDSMVPVPTLHKLLLI